MSVPIDLSPVRNNPELNNVQAYAYPFTAITVRATALLRFIDQPCLLAPEPPSIVAMVNAVALAPERPLAPAEMCKNCATSRYLPAQGTLKELQKEGGEDLEQIFVRLVST